MWRTSRKPNLCWLHDLLLRFVQEPACFIFTFLIASYFGFSCFQLKYVVGQNKKVAPMNDATFHIFYRLPLMYGWPDAFGATALPMNPANARIVST